MVINKIFPIIRKISSLVTPLLLKTKISPNQVTAISMVLGIIAGIIFSLGAIETNVLASFIFFLSYLGDHCDGEMARARGIESNFGKHFDTFSDWLVHSIFFCGLGWAILSSSGSWIWFWMGVLAAFGGTLNYIIGLYLQNRKNINTSINMSETNSEARHPEIATGWLDTLIYAFRELARADFWLLVIILTILDLLWVLLPLGAVGAQIYWLLLFFSRDPYDKT